MGIYRELGVILYDGTGYIQGIGFKFIVDYLYIFRIRFLTHAYIDVGGEWTSEMAKRFSDNWIQEKSHINYILDQLKKSRNEIKEKQNDSDFYLDVLENKTNEKT